MFNRETCSMLGSTSGSFVYSALIYLYVILYIHTYMHTYIHTLTQNQMALPRLGCAIASLTGHPQVAEVAAAISLIGSGTWEQMGQLGLLGEVVLMTLAFSRSTYTAGGLLGIMRSSLGVPECR